MAIAPTGNIYKALEFDGESSRSYGVYITGQAVYNAPERDVEMVSIAGRNGAYALDKGRFQNIEVTYPAGIFADNETDFRNAISDFRNFLCSKRGYVRLTDEYNPTEYRMAIYKSGLEVEPTMLQAGEFSITFECKPQRWLTDGENKSTMGVWGDTETETGSIVEIDNSDSMLAIKSDIIEINAVQSGSGTPSPDNVRPITGWTEAKVYVDTIYGGSIAWNQLLKNGDFSNGTAYWGGGNASISAQGGVLTVAIGGAWNNDARQDIQTYLGHKYFVSFEAKADIDFGLSVGQVGTGAVNKKIEHLTTTFQTFAFIYGAEINSTTYRITKYTNGSNNIGDKFYIKNFHLHDLTQMFGSTVADNIYNMEQSEAGSGVAYFKSLFPKDYYAYNAGTTTCVSAVNGEPYNLYTVSLGGTRYGGTLDVTTGTLTVTHGYVDLGTLTWARSATSVADTYRFYSSGISSVVQKSATTSTVADIICSQYEAGTSNTTWNASESIAIHTNGNIYVYADAYKSSSAADFKTAMSGVQLVYPLATPTTVSLTAEEIELLTGTNYVWADTGDSTIEYGTDPNKIYNPTLFDASPMLEVEGYGTIEFNGYEIELENKVVGIVSLLSNYKSPTSGSANNTAVFTATLNNTALLNIGDSITVNNVAITYSPSRASGNTTIFSSATVDSSQNFSSCSAYIVGNRNFEVSANLGPTSFTYGTSASSSTGQVSVTIINSLNVSYTKTLTLKLDYDGDATITITATGTGVTASWSILKKVVINTVYGDSSVSALGNPTYIDCDIGSAYLIDNNEAVSLNAYIDLGSDLPKLASGANTITFDNTVTDLKVIPRWWKV